MVRKIKLLSNTTKFEKLFWFLVISDINMIKTATADMRWLRNYLSKTKRLQLCCYCLSFNKESSLKSHRIT